jgi:hypothetical protein
MMSDGSEKQGPEKQGSWITDQGSENTSNESSPDQSQMGVPPVSILRPGKTPLFSRLLSGPALILFAAFVAIIPQLIRGNSCGHDFNVHLVSWLDCLNAWKHGLFYPHWTPSANYGAGEPRFVFYPPLTWMLGAALGAIFPWSFAPIAFTFLCLAGTGLATRALALEALNDASATLAGCVAIFSGFALFTAYERAAFPEFTGGIWLPLLLLFALRERRGSATEAPCPILSRFFSRKGGKPQTQTRPIPINAWRRALDGSTVPLALVLAAAWLSNAPLGVIACYLLAGVALIAAVTKKSWAPVLRAVLATGLGLGLIAFYLLPAALERQWVDIKQATDDPAYNFENSWLFARHSDPVLALHDVVLRQASFIAVWMIAVAVICLAIAWRRGTLSAQPGTGSRVSWIPLAAIPFAIFFLLLPISRPVWHLLPEFAYLQYPWRWLEALEAPLGIFFAAAVWPVKSRGRRSRIVVSALCSAVFVTATIYAATAFFQPCYDEDTVAATLAAFRTGAGFEGMYEYEPPNADLTMIAKGLPAACLVDDPAIVLGKPNTGDPEANPVWSSEQPGCIAAFPEFDPASSPEHLRFSGFIDRPGFLVMRLLSFPAWRVHGNGVVIRDLPFRTDGLLSIPVAAGPVDVSVDWMLTADVAAGRLLSAFCLVLIVLLWWIEMRLVRTGLK